MIYTNTDLVHVFSAGGSKKCSAALFVSDRDVGFAVEKCLHSSQLTVICSSMQRRLFLLVLFVDERIDSVWTALGCSYELLDDGLDDFCFIFIVAFVRDVV